MRWRLCRACARRDLCWQLHIETYSFESRLYTASSQRCCLLRRRAITSASCYSALIVGNCVIICTLSTGRRYTSSSLLRTLPWLTLRHCGYPGLSLKWIIWLFACIGVLYQYTFHEKYKTVETLLYVAIAAGPSVAIFTMNDRSGLGLMGAGGLAYLVGVVFFKLDGIIPFAHAIWHVHVLPRRCFALLRSLHLVAGAGPSEPVPRC
uniref:Monocyte to macrophage differentiation protein n=1 Tax=Ascaris suum TaxID=6253 RepID=F1KRV2_ASCSU